MLIYVSIVTITLAIVVNVCLTLSRSYSSLREAKDIGNAVTVGLETMVREIRGAESVDTANSSLATSTGRLTLSTTENGAASTVEFYLATSTIHMKRGGVYEGPLTLSNVSVTELTFNHIASSTLQAVKIEMVVQTGSGSTTRTERLYDTVVLRGSYQ